MHDNGFVHGDLKPENVMLSKDMRSAKLIDFDSSMIIEEGKDRYAYSFTPMYTTRKRQLDQQHVPSIEDDTFALGVLIYWLKTGLWEPTPQDLLKLSFTNQSTPWWAWAVYKLMYKPHRTQLSSVYSKLQKSFQEEISHLSIAERTNLGF
jgi:serine/threonine protein kinase